MPILNHLVPCQCAVRNPQKSIYFSCSDYNVFCTTVSEILDKRNYGFFLVFYSNMFLDFIDELYSWQSYFLNFMIIGMVFWGIVLANSATFVAFFH